MSKADNLKDFLTDVANAIRAKKGSTDLINPQNFSAEIAALSGGLEVIEMTETTATIEPNKVYVWGMVESLDITLGASTDDSDFFAFRFRCSKPTMTSVTVNSATWAEDTELDAQGKPVLDPGSWYQCEIKGGTSALYARLAHYIPFKDAKVEAVLLSKGIGDGLGVTYKDAENVTSISTWFTDNADITSFAEFINFSGIRDVKNSAFSSCSSLAEIALPASITYIGITAFQNCSSLTRVINLENTKVTSIDQYAFRYCSSLAEIAFPDTLTSIGRYAFQGCSSLAEIAFPDTLTNIGSYAFYGCKLLTSVINLENTKVTDIWEFAFSACSSLAEITLPTGVTSIRNYAFFQSSSLQYIRIEATTPPTLSSTNAIPSSIGAIYVPDESVETYKAATNWSSFASKIKGISEMPA